MNDNENKFIKVAKMWKTYIFTKRVEHHDKVDMFGAFFIVLFTVLMIASFIAWIV